MDIIQIRSNTCVCGVAGAAVPLYERRPVRQVPSPAPRAGHGREASQHPFYTPLDSVKPRHITRKEIPILSQKLDLLCK